MSDKMFDNTSKRVMLVFGTRPEAIKMAPLCHQFKEDPDLSCIVCVTAQHREMLDQVLDLFDIEPDIDLNIMKENQDLFDLTSAIIARMGAVLREKRPDFVLVHGDTTTTLATSIACFYLNVPVGHVEAGLRTHNLRAPFPEELNRRLTSIVSDLHFVPTQLSRENLLSEKIDESKIHVTGNTVIDALNWMLRKIDKNTSIKKDVEGEILRSLPFDYKKQRFILITGHRRENFGEGFLNICKAISELARDHQDIHFVYPVHLNPNVQQPVFEVLSGHDNVHLIAPLNYAPFVYLLRSAWLVLTDSGGIQEEAPSLGVPVLVMRDVTERPEAVEAGTVRLVGASRSAIVNAIKRLLSDADEYRQMSGAHNPYGDGQASSRIVNKIKEAVYEEPK